jgi:dTMP kinase
MKKAPFIVIDGTDGSGKGTQTDLLVQRLQREGYAVRKESFPHYGHPAAADIEKYLRGEFGQLSARDASIIFAKERRAFTDEIRATLNAGTIIIADRYVSASKGHQMAKIANPKERKEFLDWLNGYEYGELGIPKPDLTVLLHVPAEIAYELVAQKDQRSYLQGKQRDIHEADINHLKAAEQAFLELPKMDTVEHWDVISCVENGKILDRETIHDRLWRRIEPLLA